MRAGKSNRAQVPLAALLLGVVLVVALLFVLKYFLQGGGGGYGGAPKVPVRLTKLKAEEFFEQVELLGEVRSRSDGSIRGEVAGVVSEILADVGDSVSKGQIVAVLEGSEQRLMQAEAAARLAEGRSRLNELQNGTRPEVLAQRRAEWRAARAREAEAVAKLEATRRLGPKLLAQKEAEYRAAVAAEVDAADQFKRTEGLVSRGALAERELIAVRTTWERAKADLTGAEQARSAQVTMNRRDELAAISQMEAARAQTLTAEATLEESKRGARSEVVEAQRGVVAALEASRDRASLSYARTEIRSTVAGVVRERLIGRGDRVEVGTALFTVSGPDVELYFEVPESMLGRVEKGQTVLLKFPTSEKQHKGEVIGASSAADPRSRRQAIRVGFEGSEALPGSSVRGTLLVPVSGDYLVLDRDALVQKGQQWFVYSIDAEKKAVQHPVTLLGEQGERVAVSGLGSLGPEAEIIGRGSPGLYPGAEVALPQPKPSSSPEEAAK